MKTLEEIKQELQDEKEKGTKVYVRDKGYDMCKEFLDNNKFSRGEHILELDVWECVKCTLYVKSNKKYSLEDCERLRNICEITFEPMDHEEFLKIMEFMLVLASMEDSEDVLSYLSEDDPKQAEEKLRNVKEPKVSLRKVTKGVLFDSNYQIYLKKLRALHQKVGVIDEILNQLKDNPDSLGAALTFALLRKQTEEGMKQAQEELDAFGFVPTREKHKAFKQIFSKIFSIEEINSVMRAITGFITDEDKRERDIEKDNQRAQKMFDKTIELLEKASQVEEIKNARELIRNVPNDQIKKDILEWVYEHNQRYYNQLETQLEDLSSKEINQYIAVLGRFGISLHPKDMQLISHHSPKDVEEILSLLPINTYSVEEMIYILQVTTPEIARRIKKYIEAGYISSKKVIENIFLYDAKDERLEKMESSIQKTSINGVNPRIFANQPEFFWMNHKLLIKNISTLAIYNLARMLKTIDEFDFLLEEGLAEKIDTWIELGFYPYLEQNLALLNHSMTRVRRLQLLRQMNIPVEDSDTVESVLENAKFIVSDGKIEEYIQDYASTQKPLNIPFCREDLEKVDNDKVSFSLGGTIISFPKVKRQIQDGKPMWNALFSGTKYTEEDYKHIMSILMPNEDCKK